MIVIGAGLSGIGAAYHLQTECPNKTYAVLESREAIGGTWDLFRYPGIRSDSDMYTLGYRFKPWEDQKAIADGPSILEYVRETARENGIDSHIRFRHRVRRASWSSETATWTVEVERTDTGETLRLGCNFLFGCTGYYDYEGGYTPDFPGVARFGGTLIHPQKWPEGFDYTGKRVVVIGSGATAVTLVPELAEKAAHVVMLQRSPTYIVSRPAADAVANWLRERLPAKLAYGISRWKNVLLSMAFFELARRAPELTKKRIKELVREELGEGYDVETHFNPSYDPWDQRLCLVPDSDLFRSIRDGRASVVTDRIETFTEKGLKLESGEELEADVVVTATGLVVKFLGGMEIEVDGRAIDPAETMNYKGVMFSEVPNLAYTFGYTNASWTLKADLTSEYICRLLRHMDAVGADTVIPRLRDPSVREAPFVDFSSGYIQRALRVLPKQGTKSPWRLYQNYILDILFLRHAKVDDGVLELGSSRERSHAAVSGASSRARAASA